MYADDEETVLSIAYTRAYFTLWMSPNEDKISQLMISLSKRRILNYVMGNISNFQDIFNCSVKI